jgi:hypothetical protein
VRYEKRAKGRPPASAPENTTFAGWVRYRDRVNSQPVEAFEESTFPVVKLH